MRITKERNVVAITIITACVLAAALWFAGVTSHAALPRLKSKSANAVDAPIPSALAAADQVTVSGTTNAMSGVTMSANFQAPPIWEPVVLTAAQVEIKTWTFQGITYAYLKLLFPNAGYRVVNFGQATRAGNDFTGDASVEKWTGNSVEAVTTTAGIYDLGPLANGNYTFTFKDSGTGVKSRAFTISSDIPPPNPIDTAREFVKQQYRDFLNREADQAGEDFWTDNITKCTDPARRPAGQTEAQCTLRQRETTSGAFFLSPEFQYTGYYVLRMYQGALGRQPKLSEFIPDAQFVGAGIVVNGQLSGALINQNKAAFAAQFVNCTDATRYRCAEFKAIFDVLNNQAYVDKLFQTTGVSASAVDRTALVNGLTGGTETRASVLQKVVDGINVISEGNQQFTTTYGQAFYDQQFTRAFVQLEYFGYMKRDPDDAGYAFWLGKLNQYPSFVEAEMVLAFISSPEYRERFIVVAQGSTVVIDKPSVFFPASGQSSQLTAQILDAQGAPSPGSVTWTSTAPDKVSVDATGKLLAKTIGSAQIIAEAPGIRSAPTLVIVAQPQPGALLVTDAQVVSVGPPLGLAAGDSPGVGTQYEVTLQGVTAPALGTVVLAAATAPVAGKVVATRQGAGGLVVTLALAPLYELFSAYDIDLTIDLSSFPVEAVPAQSAQALLSEEWNAKWSGDPRALATTSPHDEFKPEPFKQLDCDTSLKLKLGSPPIQLSPEVNLELVLEDRPGYSKHALEGSVKLEGSVGIKLEAGFEASGRCDALREYVFKGGGWFSLIVAPAVYYGFGAELKSEILLVQAELGATGTVGLNINAGWECGGATPECRSLDNITPVNDFKTKSKIPSENDMQAKVSAHFFAVAGLRVGVGKILEGRIGPKQFFDLAFEEDQAARTDYASTYDLKVEGVIEPGSALQKAIEKVIGDDSTALKFKAESSTKISESPKGSLSVSKSRVAIGTPVDFTVDLTPDTTLYKLLGYNVTGVELYRKGEGDLEFKQWESMSPVTSYRATYHWVPEGADAGKYEFAAFVNTQVLTPLLEVSPNSVQKVEVSCFTAGGLAARFASKASLFAMGTGIGAQASTCADTWVGTATTGNLYDGPNVSQSNLTLKVDTRVDGGHPAIVMYYAEGTVKFREIPFLDCKTLAAEATVGGPFRADNSFSVDYRTNPATFWGVGFVEVTRTTVCPGHSSTSLHFESFFSSGRLDGKLNTLSADGLTIQASRLPIWSFQFTRP